MGYGFISKGSLERLPKLAAFDPFVHMCSTQEELFTETED